MGLTSNKSDISSPLSIPAGALELQGDLLLPEHAIGLVLFAHGSGSSRLSPRNKYVANVLYKAGLAAVLVDLLTFEEELIDQLTGQLRFDIPFLSDRLVNIIDWLIINSDTEGLKIGLFGASTGAAAAIAAAERRDKFVSAVVSRGGRPDLAGEALGGLQSPTLLIVGEADVDVLELNKKAFSLMQCKKKLITVPKATHLFEEPGTLQQVALLAQNWFTKYLQL